MPLAKLVEVEPGDAMTRINDGRADRSGGFVPELVELSDVLPPQVFDVRNFL